MQLPQLVAHRGLARRHAENTIAALSAAVEAGARWLETDVQLSRDAVPMLFHDRRLWRMTGRWGSIHSHSAQELRTLRSEGEPIAALEDLVGLMHASPEVECFVEIKPIALERFGDQTTLEAVRSVLSPVQERCIWISFSIDFIHLASQAGVRRTGIVLEEWRDLEDPRIEEISPEVVFVDVKKIPDGIRAPRPHRFVVYEIDRADAALALFERGFQMIETFTIDALLEEFDALQKEG